MTDPPPSPAETPLHWLALSGDNAAISALISSSPSTSLDTPSTAEDNLGQPALHWAAISGHAQTLSLLLSLGASPTLADARGYTALTHATIYGHLPCVRVLHLTAPSLAHARDARRRTPLAWAAHFGHSAIVAYLLSVAGASARTGDDEGTTPLHWAAGAGEARLCEVLLRAGADARVADLSGRRAEDVAEGRCVAVLREAGEGRWRCVAQYWFFAVMYFLVGAAGVQTRVFVDVSALAVGEVLVMYALVAVAFVAAHVAAFSSPGYVARGSREAFAARVDEVLATGKDGMLLPAEFCFSCLAPRPPRSKHCSSADRCVLRFDHYCPFLVNNVGLKNNRSLVILSAAVPLAVVLFLRAVWRTAVAGGGELGAWSVLIGRPVLVLVCVALISMAIFSASLFFSQAKLIAKDDTTFAEIIRKRASQFETSHSLNSERAWRNCLQFWFPGGAKRNSCLPL